MQHYGILYTGKAHLHLERSHREIKGKWKGKVIFLFQYLKVGLVYGLETF
jgi:hypothetical protein